MTKKIRNVGGDGARPLFERSLPTLRSFLLPHNPLTPQLMNKFKMLLKGGNPIQCLVGDDAFLKPYTYNWNAKNTFELFRLGNA
jgi:hypothetical protein